MIAKWNQVRYGVSTPGTPSQSELRNKLKFETSLKETTPLGVYSGTASTFCRLPPSMCDEKVRDPMVQCTLRFELDMLLDTGNPRSFSGKVDEVIDDDCNDVENDDEEEVVDDDDDDAEEEEDEDDDVNDVVSANAS